MLHEGKDDIYIILLHPDQYKVRHIEGFPQTFLNEGGHKTSLWMV